MKTLITGATGFLGSALVRRLLETGHSDLRCLVRAGSNTNRLEALISAYPDSSVELFVGSLASIEKTAPALEDVDTVLHLAAGLKGSAADLFLNSVVCSKNLLEAIARTGRKIKVVHVSSFGVYAAAAMRPGEVLTEGTPLESEPIRRDLYSYAKLRQEQLFWEYSRERAIPLVVLRPGVIYGPSGARLSVRIGLSLGPLFLFLGGRNRLPLTYVDNCADAIIAAAESESAVGQPFNVHDDDLPTCAEYLRRYRQEVGHLRVVRMPYRATLLLSRWMERYHKRSKGQLPAVLTPYKARANWKGARFDNSKIKSLGWRPLVSTDEGLRRTFAYFRDQDSAESPALAAAVTARPAAGRT